MKANSLNELKKELDRQETGTLRELCLRLARYKKENKELLTYLLFEADNEAAYVQGVKGEISEQFSTLSKGNLYYVKKSLRKILRLANKQIRYSGVKESEIEIRIHFCAEIRNAGIQLEKSPVLMNLYQQQIKKIDKAMAGLPEDLRFDYHQALTDIR